MKRIGLVIPALLLSSAVFVPMTTKTSAKPQGVSIRFYDRGHRDYHDWDDVEARRYERWRREHREFRVEFRRNVGAGRKNTGGGGTSIGTSVNLATSCHTNSSCDSGSCG